MPWWGWVFGGIAAWLFMVRWSMRWCRELYPETNLDVHVVLSMLCPCFAILGLFPDWLKKQGCRLDERPLRTLVGESRWHRAERLTKEHEQRCRDLGLPT